MKEEKYPKDFQKFREVFKNEAACSGFVPMNRFVYRKLAFTIFFILLHCFRVWTQEVDIELSKMKALFQTLQNYSENIPHEKVYLHFDNTSYYQGDQIWFKCYITSTQHRLSDLSKTLYVELLNPGGEIIDKRILKIENGQCHGDFTLTHIPFYSGFFEVRAYTKYMLNFGDDVIFSRILPVFDKPKEEGVFEEKKMLNFTRWGIRDYPIKREIQEKEKKVNLRFFPEGGNLIQGVASRVAFEATDEVGNPIEVTGVVMDGAKQEICSFAGTREGRGVFTYMPLGDSRRKDIAVVEYAGKKYEFSLPSVLPQGFVIEIDNLSNPDSLEISLRKNSSTPSEMLGIAVMNYGRLQNVYFFNIEEDENYFLIDKRQLPSGVSQITLFNSKGDMLCDRLIFTNLNRLLNNELLVIKEKTGKPVYRPYEAVDMEIEITDKDMNPVNTTFSLSVRDGENEVECRQNIMTDLLLMSEIKGYVRNPAYYFEEGDDAALDLLLMVQGWRRYSWKMMTDAETLRATSLPFKNLPEQSIETHGVVESFVKHKPLPNVDVSMMLSKKGDENEAGGSFIETFVTDEQGRFFFGSDVTGRWSMILSVTEKGKKKDHLITLDRVFSTEPRKYSYADMQVHIAEKADQNIIDKETPDQPEDGSEEILVAYRDSLAKLGIDERVLQLKEVTVKGKRSVKAQEIARNRSTSVTYYDIPAEMDDLYDKGTYIGKDIHELLINMNKNFKKSYNVVTPFLGLKGPEPLASISEVILYKERPPLFVINYKRVIFDNFEFDYFKYLHLPLNAIKSIYINEKHSALCDYCPYLPCNCLGIIGKFGCVVFIETYPGGLIPAEGAKGVRKTWLEGYSAVKEFYSPNYSELPPEPNDYRRTLYWNPSITTDENGKAKVDFYNNSRCTNFNINAETVTEEGRIGVYKQ